MRRLIKLSMPAWAFHIKTGAISIALIISMYCLYQSWFGSITKDEENQLILLVAAAVLFQDAMVIGTLKVRKGDRENAN